MKRYAYGLTNQNIGRAGREGLIWVALANGARDIRQPGPE